MRTTRLQSRFQFLALLVLLCLVTLGLTGCGDGAESSGLFEEDDRPKVLALTTMIADAAKVVAGDDAQVVGLMRAGEDPHTYEINPRDAVAVAEADLVLGNGLHLESTLKKIVANQAADTHVYLAESGGITPLSDSGSEGAPDPHCWMDVELFKVYVEGIRDALVEADPGNAEGYEERADAYLKELDSLDAWVREQFEAVPQQQRVIITGHDAFNYYGEAYGVEVHGLIGLSTEEQPTAADVTELENLIRAKGIKAIFYETSVSQTLNDLVKQMAEETGINVGGELYSDSLGETGTDAGTYIGIMRHNTTTMVEALKSGG